MNTADALDAARALWIRHHCNARSPSDIARHLKEVPAARVESPTAESGRCYTVRFGDTGTVFVSPSGKTYWG